MKRLTVTMLIAISIFMASVPAFGNEQAFDATMDILLVRPVSLAATVVGTAVFIVSLPFSIPSQSAVRIEPGQSGVNGLIPSYHLRCCGIGIDIYGIGNSRQHVCVS